mgnify:CR=1 FL=1
MNLKKWELLKTKEEFTTKFFSVEKRSYKLPNGKVVDDYYHINRPNYVLIIAVNSKNEILIERTYRRGMNDFVIEIPAGWIDKDEDPLDAGIRELSEETGFTGKAEVLGDIYTQAGYMNQKAYIIKIIIDELNVSQPKREDDEDIEIEFLSMDEIDKLVLENKTKDMGMLSALAVYDRMNK